MTHKGWMGWPAANLATPFPPVSTSRIILPPCPFKFVHQLCMARALQISVCVCIFCACGILCHDDDGGPRHFQLFMDSKLRHKQNNSIKLRFFPILSGFYTTPQKILFPSLFIGKYWQWLYWVKYWFRSTYNCQPIRF